MLELVDGMVGLYREYHMGWLAGKEGGGSIPSPSVVSTHGVERKKEASIM